MQGFIAVAVLLAVILLGWAVANIGMVIMAFVMGIIVCLIGVACLHRKPKPPKQ